MHENIQSFAAKAKNSSDKYITKVAVRGATMHSASLKFSR